MSFPDKNNFKTDLKSGPPRKQQTKVFTLDYLRWPYKDHLWFCKNYTYQIFTFINSKVVYFKKHIAYPV